MEYKTSSISPIQKHGKLQDKSTKPPYPNQYGRNRRRKGKNTLHFFCTGAILSKLNHYFSPINNSSCSAHHIKFSESDNIKGEFYYYYIAPHKSFLPTYHLASQQPLQLHLDTCIVQTQSPLSHPS